MGLDGWIEGGREGLARGREVGTGVLNGRT